MKIPDKWNTKLIPNELKFGVAVWRAYQNNSWLPQINILYPLFPFLQNFSFSSSRAHCSNLTFSEFATFYCSCCAGTHKQGRGSSSFSFFYGSVLWIRSVLSSREESWTESLSRLVSEISRICLQQQEMVITVDQGIRLLPYGFAKYTARVNHFHLSTFSSSAKLSVFLSHPSKKKKS